MAVTSLTELWHEIVNTQADPPHSVLLASGAVALVAVVPQPIWRLTRNAVTIAHEGGHALVALCTGRRLSGIRLHADTSGVTVSYGKPRGPGMVLTALAGYVAPALLGLAGAALLGTGHITALLWSCVVLLALMLLMIRNGYGVLALVAVGALVFGVTWYATSQVQAAFADFAVWFLLFGGVRPVFELQWQRGRGRAPQSDADQLAKLTGVPGLLWVLFFGLVALGCALLGAHWLLPTWTTHLALPHS
jgi:Peptidase M50B-like